MPRIYDFGLFYMMNGCDSLLSAMNLFIIAKNKKKSRYVIKFIFIFRADKMPFWYAAFVVFQLQITYLLFVSPVCAAADNPDFYQHNNWCKGRGQIQMMYDMNNVIFQWTEGVWIVNEWENMSSCKFSSKCFRPIEHVICASHVG